MNFLHLVQHLIYYSVVLAKRQCAITKFLLFRKQGIRITMRLLLVGRAPPIPEEQCLRHWLRIRKADASWPASQVKISVERFPFVSKRQVLFMFPFAPSATISLWPAYRFPHLSAPSWRPFLLRGGMGQSPETAFDCEDVVFTV